MKSDFSCFIQTIRDHDIKQLNKLHNFDELLQKTGIIQMLTNIQVKPFGNHGEVGVKIDSQYS